VIIGGPDVAPDSGFGIAADSTLDLNAYPSGTELWAVRSGSRDIEVQVFAI
jgi:hypothetical protein